MRYRQFGNTGWKVSEIGFGGWQIGGDWGAVDDATSIRTLHHAFHKGINFVDTAQMYGDGHSETVIGQALRQWRGDRILVATKVQPTVWPAPDEDDPQMRGRYPEWHLRQAVDASLRRLGVDRIDLLQLHCWLPAGTRALDWLETLNALRSEGKVDRIGVSIRDYRPRDGVELAQLGLVDSMQVVFNMFEQRPAEMLFNTEPAPAFIVRVPLDSGSLAGTWTHDTYASWQPGSVRHSLFRGSRFAETLERVAKIRALCLKHYPTMIEAAMRFVLYPSRVSTVIPGMATPGEVDANIAFCDGAAFPDELASQLRPHRWPRNYYQ